MFNWTRHPVWRRWCGGGAGLVQGAGQIPTNQRRAVAQGWRVESQSTFNAILVSGHPTNHVAYLLGVIVTCGLWVIGWVIAMVMEKPEQRMTLRVDAHGNVIRG